MKKLIFLSFLTSTICAMELATVDNNQKWDIRSIEHDRVSYADNKNKMYIEPFSVKVPKRLGELDLYHSKKGFYVRQDDQKFTVKKYFTDPILRDITKTQLKAFLTEGYLSINQMSDGEYSLKAKGRLIGGGPALGVAAYWITKSICYAVGFAAIGGATAATGGAIGGAVAGIGAAGGIAVGTAAATTTTVAAIGTTAGVVVGTAGAGATIASAAAVTGAIVGTTSVAGTAAVTTAAAVTSAGGIGATIAGIEAVSTAVGTFFGMLPTP